MVRLRQTSNRASALIAVYWVIALLSISVFTAVQILTGDMLIEARRGQLFRAQQLADMGIAIAANPLIQLGDPLLVQELSEIESFEATILSEESRLNLNAILVREDLGLLEELFFLWGLPQSEATALSEALADWVDEDDDVTGFGAEFDHYATLDRVDLPYNRQFASLDEVGLVRGIELLAQVRPNWRSAFTLWGNGALDLTDAAPELIAAACQCSLSSAESFVAQRRGPDGLENTLDDEEYESLDEILDQLGSAVVGREDVVGRITVGGQIERIVAIGRVDDVAVEQVVILQNRGPNATVLDVQTQRIEIDPVHSTQTHE